MKECISCNSFFDVSEGDRLFYEKFSTLVSALPIPHPKRCPDCRRQVRISFRNERKFYRRTCDFSGKEILSLHPSDSKYKVYSYDAWWSDSWDAEVYGRNFDFSRKFFEQFQALLLDVPKIALMVDIKSENSDYSPYLIEGKNCYLCIGGVSLRDCCYCTFCNYSSDSLDCAYSRNLELCYECINCVSCHTLFYSQNSNGCRDSWFLFNCQNLKNCFGCAGLTDSQYCIFNKQYSAADYQKKISSFTANYSNLYRAREEFESLKLETARRCYEGRNNEDVTGDYLNNSKSCRASYDSQDIESCCYVTNATRGRDNFDIDYFLDSELCYQCVSIPKCYGCLGTDYVWRSRNVQYSSYCFDSNNLFGCVGLKNKQHFIFNKQYSESEYIDLSRRIIQHMIDTDEYGEYFDPSLSPYSYQDTLANEYFPMSKTEALGRGFFWKDSTTAVSAAAAIEGKSLPDTVDEIEEDLIKVPIRCEVSRDLFKLNAKELDFYKKFGLPIPRRHPDQRHKDRMLKRNPRRLWSRNCDRCLDAIETTYSPDRGEKIFCTNCYRDNLYNSPS